MEKLVATDKAIALVEMLKQKHGSILFEQSSGCCDGTVPMCYQADGHYIGSQMIEIGQIAGVPYYIVKSQAEYLKNMQIIVDVMDSPGSSFSLEGKEGVGFIMHSKILE